MSTPCDHKLTKSATGGKRLEPLLPAALISVITLGLLVAVSSCGAREKRSSNPKEQNGPTRLSPSFDAGAQRIYDGALDLKLHMSVLGGRKRAPMIIKSRFQLHRSISSSSPQSIRFVDTFREVAFLSEEGAPKRFTALAKEMEGLELHWWLSRKTGKISKFHSPKEGPLLRRLGLLRALKRIYTLASAAPKKKMEVGSSWVKKSSVTTSFSGLPLKFDIAVRYRYRDRLSPGSTVYHRITGRESAVLPDIKEKKTAHGFKIGGLVKGRLEVLVSRKEALWDLWRVRRTFALAATKKSPKGGEVTFGIRYDVSMRLFGQGVPASLRRPPQKKVKVKKDPKTPK